MFGGDSNRKRFYAQQHKHNLNPNPDEQHGTPEYNEKHRRLIDIERKKTLDQYAEGIQKGHMGDFEKLEHKLKFLAQERKKVE